MTGPAQRIPGAAALPRELRGGVVAIGNFDGVHRGHQAVVETLAALAAETGAPRLALTFEPHPRTVFRPQHPVQRLTPAPLKARLFGLLGVEAVVEQPFDLDYAAHPAEAFVAETLHRDLGARHVVVGYDFRFGARRQGDLDFLRARGAELGIGVTSIAPFVDEGANTVSSSRIREDLMNGDAAAAAGLLGYRWTIEGTVSHGAKLGRTLGYPTANMVLPDDGLLAHGIYAVRLRRADGSLHDGVASYGRRPTFDNGAALFETFLFDFSGDLYGEAVSVSLFGFIRGEERFDSAEALIARMDIDAAEARALLAGARPLSPLDAALTF
ncbi:bifunctional riboflavin kinase/FAD synthetase [Aureimonas phyllosphaerae]|uniref:Riboflavin biosynthesis protein n=1 Tax=Aureimonas phyllosphaerae TaxID=1166078 RepID=A0A7W6FW90_9HYPH|nr:bifunctional riboflavin kinase/FAD synthetase [Aureimonas phyllosphaerae]MBB3936827.1 riboflavin kinase/FMN adenylyltransferase [Aureimonas phyllosphaerae]MBB3961058.1 riboflavin kinase/FMN adenylyltransferase [Aureimonas phyllosphaerae]SFF26345.1 FMN adenylyltransferase /riboflavin kinase [Aureimonas phyllosphaerae]